MTTNFQQMIEDEYQRACATPSDINEHLPLLRELAESVSSVTEMGVRTGNSTRAFLTTTVRLRAIDLTLDTKLQDLFNHATAAGRDAVYIQGDVLAMTIDETDLLFIDTWHTYKQLSAELKRHAPRARRYIAFHDTVFFGLRDEQAQQPYLNRLAKKICPRPIRMWLKKISFIVALDEAMNNHSTTDSGKNGLLPAILHYLADNPGQWQVKIHKTNNSGLTVLERIGT